MNGEELKKRLKDLHLKARFVAEEMGVTEQAMTSFYKTAEIRKDTLDRIEKAIRHLTDGRYGLFKEEDVIPEEKQCNAPLSEQQEAFDFAAKQVSTLMSQLADAIELNKKYEQQMLQRLSYLDDLVTKYEKRFDAISRYVPERNIPGFEPVVGNLVSESIFPGDNEQCKMSEEVVRKLTDISHTSERK